MSGGDDMKKVQPGEPMRIAAKTFNTFIDAARAVQGNAHNIGADNRQTFRQTGIILVQNNCGADRSRFDVLAIDSPIITPTVDADEYKSRVAMIGVAPALSHPPGAFVVLAEPIADGDIGRAYFSGVCPVKLNVVNELHTHADIWAGDYVLKTGTGIGAEILWQEPGTGEVMGTVLLRGGMTWWKASIIDGREVGRSNAYVHAGDNSANEPMGYYIDEIRWNYNHHTGWPSSGQPQSRTRDAYGNWIPTFVYPAFGAASFWPIPLRTSGNGGTGILVPVELGLYYSATHTANYIYNYQCVALHELVPKPCTAKITALNWSSTGLYETTHYRTHDAHFMWGGVSGYEVPGLTVKVRVPYRSGCKEFPLPQVGDVIPIVPVLSDSPPRVYWYDMTPRITVPTGSWVASSTRIYHDDTLDGYGRLWSTDT